MTNLSIFLFYHALSQIRILGCTSSSTVCWWHMHDGRVLGVHDGQVVEYDAETLSPLGIVVSTKELRNREVLVVDNSKAIVLVDPDTDSMEIGRASCRERVC